VVCWAFSKDKISAEDNTALMGALPGAESLIGADKSEAGGGGLMGGLMSAAGGLTGGKVGGALGVMSILKSANLDSNTGGSLVKMLFDFVQTKAGAGLVSRILEQVPDLEGMLK